jgi:hypothetical protein
MMTDALDARPWYAPVSADSSQADWQTVHWQQSTEREPTNILVTS